MGDFEEAWRLQDQRLAGNCIPEGCNLSKVLQYRDIAGLGSQSKQAREIFPAHQIMTIVFDHFVADPAAIYRATLSTSHVYFVHQRFLAKSLSFARNEAVRRAASDLVLFIDADVVAQPDWARTLKASLSEEGVGVAGTRILPRWHVRPLRITRSRLVQDQYSVYDLGEERRSIRRVVGASFAIHRVRLGEDAYFDERLGRREGLLFGGEDSKLCRRAATGGLKIICDGRAFVRHQIAPERIRYRWVMQRFCCAGILRAQLGNAPNRSNPWELWDYLALPLVLPSYLAGFLWGKLQRAF